MNAWKISGRCSIAFTNPFPSSFVLSARAPYIYDAAEAGIRTLTKEEIHAEASRFKMALRSWAQGQGVRLSHYDIRELVY